MRSNIDLKVHYGFTDPANHVFTEMPFFLDLTTDEPSKQAGLSAIRGTVMDDDGRVHVKVGMDIGPASQFQQLLEYARFLEVPGSLLVQLGAERCPAARCPALTTEVE